MFVWVLAVGLAPYLLANYLFYVKTYKSRLNYKMVFSFIGGRMKELIRNRLAELWDSWYLPSYIIYFYWPFSPTKCSPPEWGSTPDLPGGMWRWAVSSRHHSWLCTAGPGWGYKVQVEYLRCVWFSLIGMHIACFYPAFIQLCSDGFHKQRHGRGWPRDVGGARVNHGRAALRAEHQLHPHWNAGEKRNLVGNPASPWARKCCIWLHLYPFMVTSHLPVALVPM